MTLKIYTVHHFVPRWFVANDVFVPFIVGAAGEGPIDPVFQTDLEEPTLHGNESLAEMRCHYWVWTHLPIAGVIQDDDYVGFQHYRRAFISALAGGHAAEIRGSVQDFMRRDLRLTTSWITGLLQHYDIIVPRKWPALPDLGRDYGHSHSQEDWQVLLSKLPSPDLAAGIAYIYRANMFVMRADLFDQYMTWWSQIIGEIAAAITPPAAGYQSRTFGFMSERLFTMWVVRQHRQRPDLRIIELPLMLGNFAAI